MTGFPCLRQQTATDALRLLLVPVIAYVIYRTPAGLARAHGR